MDAINYPLILVAALAAIASPGPATLAIASASMSHGRIYGLGLACGVLTGRCFGLVVQAFVWRHCSVQMFGYLKSYGIVALLFDLFVVEIFTFCRRKKSTLTLVQSHSTTLTNIYFKGLLIHLTNPKANIVFRLSVLHRCSCNCAGF
ncbi:LysE family transporter [Pokkaliibacter sp. MBI-7]|uniref:LysE family transporter n=1 Tax=Pokkaliibacter sp. MBI-7 TaxID=3040600 RepID=UPI00244695A2|nr:LysE family transporter [Pokkaliibacter sp. MBI-7]MDH2436695.1 LysE family transporter [Pokkaliibacter sp. MBI-7]